MFVSNSSHSSQAADEECLPFKMAYALCHESSKLRLFITPESTHACWNDTRNSLRRTGLQFTILLATVINNCGHGPYRSGGNQLSFEEAAHDLAKRMEYSEESFQELVDGMASDLGVEIDDPSLPQAPDQIPNLPAIRKLPVFVP